MIAGALVEDRERCLAAAMDDYLAKPIRVSELERVLSHWLANIAPVGALSLRRPTSVRVGGDGDLPARCPHKATAAFIVCPTRAGA